MSPPIAVALLLLAQAQAQLSGVLKDDPVKATPELKSMLLENLNKLGDPVESLEPLGSPRNQQAAPSDSRLTSVNSLDESLIPEEPDLEMPFDFKPIPEFFDLHRPVDRPPTPLTGFGDPFRLPVTPAAPIPNPPPTTLATLAPFTFPPIPPLNALPSLPQLLTLPPLGYGDGLASSTFLPPPALLPQPSPTSTTPSAESIKDLRNRIYRTFKRLNGPSAKGRMRKTKQPKGHDSQANVQTQRNGRTLTSNVGKLFDVEKSGYQFRQHANVQKESVDSDLKEFSFTGDRLKPFPINSTSPTKRPFEHVGEYLANKTAPTDSDIEKPCPASGCQHNPWLFQNDVIMDSTDICNNPRLRALVQNLILANDAETSKRLIQKRAEEEFDRFYNVICGTGFFSYIAHTDEFCLVNVGEMNCYVFSPVCADVFGLGSGILKQKSSRRRTEPLAGKRVDNK